MGALSRFALPLAVVSTLAAEPPPTEPPPVDSGLSTQVEVRLVTINVVALDPRERTVADLTKADFRLWVDAKETPIDTLDVFCDGGGEDDPVSKRIGAWELPVDRPGGETRRVVLAFDYLHLGGSLATQALQQYQDVLARKGAVGDEEMMVVALTGGLRIEQAFTRDRAAVVATLRRMEHDITLWNGNFRHLTERPVFVALDALTTVLRSVPGAKAVVYVSADFGPAASYENEFRRLAAQANDAQVVLYPVDMSGILDPFFRGASVARGPAPGAAPPLGISGASPGLARFASVTGGRLTHDTNDFTTGYGRARRDLGCRYMLGFYDHKPEEDKQHDLRVEPLRDGIELRYATRYWFPSPAERRSQRVQAAYLAPQMFGNGGMRAYVFPVVPKDASQWEALVAVEFPVDVTGAERSVTKREFGVVLQRGTDVEHTFHRTITLTAAHDPEGTATHRITFLEPALLRPGRYTLRAVLTDPASETPSAQQTEVDVPEIPRGGPFLVGPTLGRGGDDEVVVFGGAGADGAPADRVGGAADFRPLLVAEAGRGTPLAAITQACIVKPRKSSGPWVIERVLLRNGGEPAASTAEASFDKEPKRSVSCRRIVDQLDVRDLPPGGYVFQATLAGSDGIPVEDGTKRIPIALMGDEDR